MMTRFYHRPVFASAKSNPVQPAFQNHGASVSPTLLESAIPLLDGSRSPEDVFGQLLIDGFDVGEITLALNWLDDEGLIEESPDSELNALSAAEKARYAEQIKAFGTFTHAVDITISPLPVAGVAAQVALKRSLVVLVGMGGAGSDLMRLLGLAGVGTIIAIKETTKGDPPTHVVDEDNDRVVTRPLPPDNPFVEIVTVEQIDDLPEALRERAANLLIYCADQFDHEVCEWLNRICLSGSIALLPYRSTTFGVEIGPLVIPNETACYICYHLRRKGAILARENREDNSDQYQYRLSVQFGVDWLALEVVKLLTKLSEPVTRGRLLQINLLSGLMELHPVLKLPRCPACGVHRIRPPLKLWEE